MCVPQMPGFYVCAPQLTRLCVCALRTPGLCVCVCALDTWAMCVYPGHLGCVCMPRTPGLCVCVPQTPEFHVGARHRLQLHNAGAGRSACLRLQPAQGTAPCLPPHPQHQSSGTGSRTQPHLFWGWGSQGTTRGSSQPRHCHSGFFLSPKTETKSRISPAAGKALQTWGRGQDGGAGQGASDPWPAPPHTCRCPGCTSRRHSPSARSGRGRG